LAFDFVVIIGNRGDFRVKKLLCSPNFTTRGNDGGSHVKKSGLQARFVFSTGRSLVPGELLTLKVKKNQPF
jgi:hypothetical protein